MKATNPTIWASQSKFLMAIYQNYPLLQLTDFKIISTFGRTDNLTQMHIFPNQQNTYLNDERNHMSNLCKNLTFFYLENSILLQIPHLNLYLLMDIFKDDYRHKLYIHRPEKLSNKHEHVSTWKTQYLKVFRRQLSCSQLYCLSKSVDVSGRWNLQDPQPLCRS